LPAKRIEQPDDGSQQEEAIPASNVAIHGPGRGTNLSHVGFAASNTKGAAIPNPTARNIPAPWTPLKRLAAPSAALRNGAVHAVPRNVASTPVKNAEW